MDQVKSNDPAGYNADTNAAIIPTAIAAQPNKVEDAQSSPAPCNKGTQPKKGYWKQLWDEKPDRHIELVLSLAISFFALVQLIASCSNNKSTTQQTQQLITAAGISAYAAQQNVQAARDFASSARSINNGISDATEKLGLQAERTEDARKSSIEQSQQALDATIASSRADLRPWVGVESAVPKNYAVFFGQNAQSQLYVNFSIKNYGRSVAEKAFIYAKFILLMPSNRNDRGCEDFYTDTDLGYSVLPTQTLPLTHAMNFSREYLLKALSLQKFSTTIYPRVIGCVVYAEGTPKMWHHTPFSYSLQMKDGSEITSDMERIDDTKLVLKELPVDPGPAN